MAEQDPLINLRQDDARQELYLSLYGVVQKQVIEATLLADFGLEVEFHGSSTIHIERPNGAGAAVEFMRVAPNPFLATVGLRIEPRPAGSGLLYEVSSEALGQMPHAFYAAVEDTVHATLRQGLRGWQVTDCLVTMTHADYLPRQSHAHQRFSKSMSSTGADYRGLTPLVVMAALCEAGTTVCEPVDRFRIEAPAHASGTLVNLLARLGGTLEAQELRRDGSVLEGEIPAARAAELRRHLGTVSHGEGSLEALFERYEPVRGVPPERPRSDDNPLDRKEYLLHVQRRV
jgi:ribosomal protection tetracycline resistance protein